MKRLITCLLMFVFLSGNLLATEVEIATNTKPVAVLTSTPNQTWFYNLEDVIFQSGSSYDPDGGDYILQSRYFVNGSSIGTYSYTNSAEKCFALHGSPSNGCTVLASGVTTVTVGLQVMDNHGLWSTMVSKTYTIQEHKGRKYFVTDHIGNVRATVNRDGNVLGYDDYYPFGKVMRSNNIANPNDNYKFTGHERDTEAGLSIDYMNARTYDPITSIFMQRDPLEDQFPGWTPYHYVHNNPIKLIDPTGMAAQSGKASEDADQRNARNNLPSFNTSGTIIEDYSLDFGPTYYAGCPDCKKGAKGGSGSGGEESSSPRSGQRENKSNNAGVAIPIGLAPAGLSLSPNTVVTLGTGGTFIIVGGSVLISSVVMVDAIKTGNSEGQINGLAFVPPLAQVAQNNLLLTRDGSSKNEKHGGHGLTPREEGLIRDLEAQMEGANRKTKNALKRKISNIKKNAQRRQVGEEHSRVNKGN